jgi:hypothetical protein
MKYAMLNLENSRLLAVPGHQTSTVTKRLEDAQNDIQVVGPISGAKPIPC